MKHTHKNADGGSSELLLRYVFLLKVQKKVIKNKKNQKEKKEKQNQKRRKKVGWERGKKFLSLNVSPRSIVFFTLLSRKTRNGRFSRKKRLKKKEFNLISFFPLALSFVFWRWRRGCHAAPGSKKVQVPNCPFASTGLEILGGAGE